MGIKGIGRLGGKEIVTGSLAIFLMGNASLFAGVTGDPLTDGWTQEGNTLASGTYADGTAMYSANIYTTGFTLGASSPLISSLGGFNWQTGDTIVGVGGVFVSTTAPAGGWGTGYTSLNSTGTYGANANSVNGNLTYDGTDGATSTRIVVKYGASALPAGWHTSTVAPESGNGNGSLANGGVGSILLGTNPYDFAAAGSGLIIAPTDSPLEQTASGTISISGDMGRVVTFWSGTTLVGFESFLDVTLLNSTYGSTATPPAVGSGNEFDLDLQRGTGLVTDALGTLAPIPEPGTLSLMVILGGAGLLARRRRA